MTQRKIDVIHVIHRAKEGEMIYGGERGQRERKEKIRRRIFGATAAFLITAFVVFSFFVPPATWKYYVALPQTTDRKEGECRVHFLSVGQGDCTLLEFPDGKTMLIDGGDGAEEHTAYILRYLNSLGIKTLDYLVATHPDGDHTGGLDEIIKIKKVKEAYLPKITAEAGAQFNEFIAAVKDKGCKTVFSARGVSLSDTNGEYPYEVDFLSPLSPDTPGSEYEKANGKNADDASFNDCSAVIRLDYFGSGALFLGDITAEKESDILFAAEAGLIKCGGATVSLADTEILKVAHHGSSGSSGEEFLRKIGVRDAIISVGAGNPYSHPNSETLARLRRAGAQIYRTDENGTVVATLRPDGTYSIKYR